MTGRLVLAATPIGNIADASTRLRELLGSADVIAAEDTRRLLNLASALGVRVRGTVLSYYDANEADRAQELLQRLREGQTVLLVSDAGMPLVSDPGHRVVSMAVAEGITVDAIPGPSAVTTALAVSGLPVERFTFEGFLARRGGERRAHLQSLRDERRAMVFFEAPHRLVEALHDAVEVFGADRGCAVCRELTKTYQEVVRGSLAEALAHFEAVEPRGEITVVIAGRTAPVAADLSDDDIIARVHLEQASGLSASAASAAVAKSVGLPRQAIYELVLAAKRKSPDAPHP
ncbi:MAG: 16S rRNA (cytidine(1402)-2'-O)-methyltransferase [Actinomycetales bacterium]|nr:16S rRNA (cytidine(1402)-2'-O)-methyltransferase [Actinomycetales bacterium]